MTPSELLAELAELIDEASGFMSGKVHSAAYDDDNDELVIVTENPHQEFIISSKDVREIADE